MSVINMGGLTPRDIGRLAKILTVLGRHGLGELVHRLKLPESLPVKLLKGIRLIPQEESLELTRGERLRNALTDLGPTFIKMGQILSTRPDLLPVDVCDDLSELQDRVPPFSYEKVEQMFLEEFGKKPEEMFESFSRDSVAAASLSQVHKAKLPDGTVVAVKVQRPDAARMVESDLGLLRFTARWVKEHATLETWIDPMAVYHEFERTIRKELDFVTELRHIRLFEKHFKDDPKVEIPHPYENLSTKRILTMDWVDGIPVDHIDELKEKGLDLETIADNGAHAVLKQIFEFGFIHADPHPGNIMILDDGVICFLDYGMAAILDPDDTDAIAEILMAIFTNDVKRIMKVIPRVTDERGKVDMDELEREIREYLTLEAKEVVRGMYFGRALKRTIKIMNRHNLVYLPRFSLLLKSLATIEQVAHDLNPAFDIIPITRPYISRLLKKRYSLIRMVKDLREVLTDLYSFGRRLPSEMEDVFEIVKQGELNVLFHHKGLDNLIHVLDSASNRISLAVIIGSIIVGSSLVIQAGKGPQLWGFPVMGIIGYLISVFLGLWLVIAILRSRKF